MTGITNIDNSAVATATLEQTPKAKLKTGKVPTVKDQFSKALNRASMKQNDAFDRFMTFTDFEGYSGKEIRKITSSLRLMYNKSDKARELFDKVGDQGLFTEEKDGKQVLKKNLSSEELKKKKDLTFIHHSVEENKKEGITRLTIKHAKLRSLDNNQNKDKECYENRVHKSTSRVYINPDNIGGCYFETNDKPSKNVPFELTRSLAHELSHALGWTHDLVVPEIGEYQGGAVKDANLIMKQLGSNYSRATYNGVGFLDKNYKKDGCM